MKKFTQFFKINGTVIKLSAVALFFFIASSFNAQLLINWDANNNGGGFGASPWPCVTLNPNLTCNGLIRGANIQQQLTPAGGCWGGGGGGWGTTDAGAVYFTFTVAQGYTCSLSSITSAMRRSNSGPASGNVDYSLNGGAYTVVGTWATNVTSGTTGQANSTPLSGVLNLQGIPGGTVVRIRYTFPGGGGGNWYVTNGANCIRLNGTVGLAPFTSTVAQTSGISCNGLSDGVLTMSLTNGVPPFTYSWSPAGGTSSVATGLAAGIYTCEAVSALNQITTSTFVLNDPALLTPGVLSQTNVSCNGGSNGSVEIAPTGGTPSYNYTWSPLGGNTASLNNVGVGTYTVDIEDANGCTTSETVTITQPPAITITANATSTSICDGASVTLTGGGANTYTWNGGVLNDGVAFTPTATADYTVDATDLNGCAGSATITVTVNSLPTVSVNPSNTLICNGTTVTLSGTGANTYTWTNGVSNGVAFSPSINTTYTVTGTDNNGCVNTATVDVNVNQGPTLTVTPTSTAACKNNTVILNATGANTYTWSGGITNGVAFTFSTTTVYTVTGTGPNGCNSVAMATVTANAGPTVNVASMSPTLCAGKTTTITLSGGSVTYSWSTGATTSSLVVSPTITTSYTIEGTAANGCVTQTVYTQQVSECTGIEAYTASNKSISVYPNPNTGEFSIHANAAIEIYVHNELGQLLHTVMLRDTNNFTYSFSGFAPGIYMINSRNGEVRQKMVVTH